MVEPVLEVDGIVKRFGALVASDNISLTLAPGEIHALIGPNGAGKTTLIRQICGEMRSDSGSIRFLGEDITGLGAAQRARRGLGRTFQVSSLALEMTALENVMLAVLSRTGHPWGYFLQVARDKRLTQPARECLERAGLAARAHVPAEDLSHGEKRRLEIAIALALEPKAFLMDEPMAGMGSEGAAELTRFLSGLREEAPILLIEHDMDAVFALASRITVLVYGKVIATGTADEIRANEAVREAYLGEEEL